MHIYSCISSKRELKTKPGWPYIQIRIGKARAQLVSKGVKLLVLTTTFVSDIRNRHNIPGRCNMALAPNKQYVG